MRSASLWILVFLPIVLLTPVTADAQEIPIQVLDSSGKQLHTVQAQLKDGVYYFGIGDLFRLFDPQGGQRYIPLTKRLTLRLKDRRFDLSVTRNRGTVDGQPFRLANAPFVLEGASIFVPAEFVTEVVGPQLGYTIDLNPNAQRLQIRDTRVNVPFVVTPTEQTALALILDPGHGGPDTGVTSDSGSTEKGIVLEFARQVEALAESMGLPIHLTRTDDKKVSPLTRAQEAIQNHGGMFVSVHCNRSFSASSSGIRLYVNNPRGNLVFGDLGASEAAPNEPMTGSIQEASQDRFLGQSRQFAEQLKARLEGVLGVSVPEVTELPLQPIEQVMMPAILIELGFLSNSLEETRLKDVASMVVVAQSIVDTAQLFLQ